MVPMAPNSQSWKSSPAVSATMSGIVNSVDASFGTLTVQDLFSKKPVQVKINLFRGDVQPYAACYSRPA